MKNEMSLDGYSVQVLSYEDKKNTDGGDSSIYLNRRNVTFIRMHYWLF